MSQQCRSRQAQSGVSTSPLSGKMATAGSLADGQYSSLQCPCSTFCDDHKLATKPACRSLDPGKGVRHRPAPQITGRPCEPLSQMVCAASASADGGPTWP